jgi:hypothetical protein
MSITPWLEVIRVLLGLLILLALSTLFRIFKETKITGELKLITFGFVLYTIQAFLGALQAWGTPMPIIWKLELDEFIEACMYVVFVFAIIRLNGIMSLLEFEKRVIKVLRDVLR